MNTRKRKHFRNCKIPTRGFINALDDIRFFTDKSDEEKEALTLLSSNIKEDNSILEKNNAPQIAEQTLKELDLSNLMLSAQNSNIENSKKYTQLVMCFYISECEIVDLCDCIETMILSKRLLDIESVNYNPKLIESDIFRFGWNLYKYCDIDRPLVVKFIQKAFDIDSTIDTIHRKLKDKGGAKKLIDLHESREDFLSFLNKVNTL